jgi:hypothetical protein
LRVDSKARPADTTRRQTTLLREPQSHRGSLKAVLRELLDQYCAAGVGGRELRVDGDCS